MRLAQITLPVFLNDGTTRATDAHEWLQNQLCDIFGGFTVWNADGAWKHDGKIIAEPVKVYQIAVDPDSAAASETYGAIEHLARFAGKRANQIAVFYAYDGEAHIIGL